MTGLDALDRALLDRLQVAFPLVPRPFAALGAALDLGEAGVLDRVCSLKAAGIIRQIGAIFDTRRLGYQSTLAAFCVDEAALEAAAARISAHPGVSHNYARLHHYNLWFTLAVPPGQDVAAGVENLARQAGVDDWLDLPALRVFKIRAQFRMGEEIPRQSPLPGGGEAGPSGRVFMAADIPLVRVLQRDLELMPQPFAQAARKLGLDEETLLAQARELQEAGIMRRFGAVLRHRRAGYSANGMGCWVVPEARIEEAGLHAARYAQVSHCYHRPAFPPRWPYTLFTMIHGRTRDEVEAVVARIAAETGIDEYRVLYTGREFKKERVRYFEFPNDIEYLLGAET